MKLVFTVKRKLLGKFERVFGLRFREERVREMHIFGMAAVAALRIKSAPIKDLGRFQNGWVYRAVDVPREEVTIWNTAPYAPFVEFGRRPGKPPPVDALRGWAMRHFGTESAAYGIAKNIGKRGIKPRPVMFAKTMQANLDREWDKAIDRSWWTAIRKAIK